MKTIFFYDSIGALFRFTLFYGGFLHKNEAYTQMCFRIDKILKNEIIILFSKIKISNK